MPLTVNSTFADLSYADQAAYYAPHWIYAHVARPELTYVFLVVLATALVVSGSYATVSMPKTARNPDYGRSSNLWDPTDKDGSALFVNLANAACLNLAYIDLTTALLIPVIATGALMGFGYLLRKLDVTVLKMLNYYIAFVLVLLTTVTLQWLLAVAARNVGFTLGLSKNLGFFFRRYRLTLSGDEKLPLGVVEPFSLKDMDMSKSEFKQFEQFMADENNVRLVKPTKVKAKKQIVSLVWDAKTLLVLPVALATLYLFYTHNPYLRADYQLPKFNWIISNFVACMFAISGTRMAKVGNFKVASVMLAMLFCYDVYFVFRSSLMVFVAQNLDVPVKLVIPEAPQTLLQFLELGSKPVRDLLLRFALLGLGDVVVPAMFTSLCLRFDYNQFYARDRMPFHHLRSIGVPKYFTAAMIGYVAAMVVTVVALRISAHGQPALLYIVPALFASVFGTAKWNNEWDEIWSYSEELESYHAHGGNVGDNPQRVDRADGQSHESDCGLTTRIIVGNTIYEFAESEDETDDTYVIDEETEDDEEDYDDDDLDTEIEYLLHHH